MHPPTIHPAFDDFSPEDKRRIEQWFDHDARLTEVAAALNTNVMALAAWAEQPRIAAALHSIMRIAHLRTATLRAEADHAAVARLLRITRFCDNEETARRAADRLHRQRSKTPYDDSDPDQPPPAPPSPPKGGGPASGPDQPPSADQPPHAGPARSTAHHAT